MANTVIHREEWKTKLQEKLEEPRNWEGIATITYTSRKVVNNPYQSAATLSAYTRGAQYTYNDITLTNEQIDVTTSYVSPEFIDRADLAQAGFAMQMERAARQADVIKDQLGTVVLADHANFGNSVDDGDLGTATNGGAGNPLILSATNVLEVIRLARQKIVEDKGLSAFENKGANIYWSPADYSYVVAAAQANGYSVSDDALTKGKIVDGLGGFKHYETNLLNTAAGVRHVVAGVAGSIDLGVLNTTYGDVMVDEKDPDNRSGISIVSRVDYGVKTFTEKKNLLVDINISA